MMRFFEQEVSVLYWREERKRSKVKTIEKQEQNEEANQKKSSVTGENTKDRTKRKWLKLWEISKQKQSSQTILQILLAEF